MPAPLAALSSLERRLGAVWHHLGASLAVWLAFPLAARADFDTSAPLDILKQGRDKARSSALNVDSITSGGSKLGTVLFILFAIAGIGLAGASGLRLYKASQNPNGHEDPGRAIMGIVIGAGLTILGVIIGLVTHYATNN